MGRPEHVWRAIVKAWQTPSYGMEKYLPGYFDEYKLKAQIIEHRTHTGRQVDIILQSDNEIESVAKGMMTFLAIRRGVFSEEFEGMLDRLIAYRSNPTSTENLIAFPVKDEE